MQSTNVTNHLIHTDGSVQDCSISSANALEILQSYTKLLIYYFIGLDILTLCINNHVPYKVQNFM